jgi:YVTN family beta-propeller protein
VIDTTSNTVAANISVPGGVGFSPTHVAFTPDGKLAYVATFGPISVLDTATRTMVATVPITARAIAFTPDGKHAFMTTDDTVTVLDTTTNTVAATVSVGRNQLAVDIAVIPLPPITR